MQDGIISTHVFYLPFSWELKNISGRQVLKGHKHKKTKDRIPLEGWKDRVFKALTDESYNEYVYFYKPAFQMLYDVEGKSMVYNYEKQGIEKESFIQIKVGEKTYKTVLRNMELRLYKNGIGLLSFKCLNKEYGNPEDIIAINSLSKSVYPYKLPLENVHKDLFPKEVIIHFNAHEEIVEKFEKDYKQAPMCICDMIRKVLGPSFIFDYKFLEKGKLFVEPLFGNRMFALCMYQNPSFLRDVKNKVVSKRFLNSFILFSKKEKLLEGATYLDLPKVVYGISRFSLVCIMESNKESKLYNQLVILALMQKASLLHFGNQIAFIADLPKNELVSAIGNLYEIYIQFISQMRFNEVTVDVQGSYIYNELLRQLSIERGVKELDFEMQEIHEYATLIDKAQSKGKMDFLTIIGTALVIPTFVTGFFGMNILQEQFMDWWKHSEIMLWFNGYVMLPVLAVLLIYSFWTKKSRKSMVTRNILLSLFVISFYILIRWGCGIG